VQVLVALLTVNRLASKSNAANEQVFLLPSSSKLAHVTSENRATWQFARNPTDQLEKKSWFDFTFCGVKKTKPDVLGYLPSFWQIFWKPIRLLRFSQCAQRVDLLQTTDQRAETVSFEKCGRISRRRWYFSTWQILLSSHSSAERWSGEKELTPRLLDNLDSMLCSSSAFVCCTFRTVFPMVFASTAFTPALSYKWALCL